MENQQQGLSAEQLTQILEAINSRSDERMINFAKELKKPSPEEQAKIDKEKAKLRERTLAAAKLAQAEEQGKENAARGCPHGTTHEGTQVFTHQWRAQVCTPVGEKPYYIPRCTQCGSTWDRVYGLPSPKVLASPEQLQGGVNMNDWTTEDVRRVVEWVRRNPVEEPVAA